MLTFKDEELYTELRQRTGTDCVTPTHFHAFNDLAADVRQQVEKVKSHPWIPKHIPVRGFIFDVKTGRLNEVAN
jgi:carbonic anhydrase